MSVQHDNSGAFVRFRSIISKTVIHGKSIRSMRRESHLSLQRLFPKFEKVTFEVHSDTLVVFTQNTHNFYYILAKNGPCRYLTIKANRTKNLSLAIQPFVGPRPLFQFLDLFTQSLGLLGRGISPSQGRYLYTGQHKHSLDTNRHPCLKLDLNPRSQYLGGWRQFKP
jgi:hypothetical protein